jgi:iron complex outermembrane receptor protein
MDVALTTPHAPRWGIVSGGNTLIRKNTSIGSFVAAAIFAAAEANSQSLPENSAAKTPNPSSASSEGGPTLIEEIIVTAQKREERLLDVPVAVTVLTGSMLENQQINDTNGLVKAVPSLTFQAGNNPSNNSFRIRGVGTSLFSLGVEPSVSVVVDGVVQARQAQNFMDLSDIERIEVLRGPQGTLFGKNATAGVISVVTARPTGELEAKSDLTVAQKDEYRWNGTVSGPLSDTVRARVSGYYNNIGGYHINAANGNKEGGSEAWGMRGKLDWDVTSRLNILTSIEYRKDDENCCQYGLVAVSSPLRTAIYAAAGVPISADTKYTWNSGQSYADSTQKTYSLQAGLDLLAVKLVSITAYQDFNIGTNFEPDRLGSSVPMFLSATSNALFDYNFAGTRTKQYSQELRLDSEGSGPLGYTVGVYYSHLDLDRDSARRRAICSAGLNVVGQPCLPATISYQSLVTDANLKNEHVAAFSQVEAEVFSGLKLLGGLRVQHESLEVSGSQLGPLPGDTVPFGTVFPSGITKASDNAITGKAGAKYEFSHQAQAYATYTRGYKGQGADTEITVNFANNPVVQPEHVNAYEVGFKGSLSDGLMSIGVAVFRADYTNLQVQANRSDPTTGVVAFQATNAGSSRIQGIELETNIRPTSDFNIGAGVTYEKPSLNANGLNCPIQSQTAAVTIALGGVKPVNTCYKYQYLDATNALKTSGAVQDVRDGETPATPHVRVTLSPRYEHAISGSLNGFVEVDASYQSKQQFAIEQDPNQIQDAYTLLDASFGIRDIQSRYSLTLFVRNLLDKNYYVTSQGSNLLPSNLNLVDKYAIRPKDADRFFGATVSFKF